MDFAVVWKTTQSGIDMDVDIVFGAGDAEFLTLASQAKNIQDSDDPGTYLFMNSFEVDQFLDNEEVSATITYVFSGAIDYTYVFEFVYGEPDPDQVVIVNEIVTVVDEPVVEPEEEDSTTKFLGFKDNTLLGKIVTGIIILGVNLAQ